MVQFEITANMVRSISLETNDDSSDFNVKPCKSRYCFSKPYKAYFWKCRGGQQEKHEHNMNLTADVIVKELEMDFKNGLNL